VLLEDLKLSKPLVKAMTEAGFLSPKEIQLQTMSRIIGGQDIVGVGPEGSGKTTTYILGVLMRLRQGFEEAPRALILVPDKEKVQAVVDQFNLLNKNKTIRIVSLIAGPSAESQMDELTDGVDIVVATPDRARAIYLKLGLNLNKIQMFVVDDADLIVKQGMQLPVNELANSIIKCQRLVFTSVMHTKLETMISPFMRQEFVVEVDEEVEASSETYPQILYPVVNFRTKINLLNLLLNDSDLYPKVAVFVNTRLTAEKLFKSLTPGLRNEAAVYNPVFFDTRGIHDIHDFLENDEVRILILANELLGSLSVAHITVIIHFELPEEKETFIPRIIKQVDSENEVLAISFATDIELTMVKKIEQAIGNKFLITDLPDGLIIDKESKVSKAKKAVPENSFNSHGGAFHEKKDSNNKDYNYSSKAKARMNKKKNHL